MSSPVNQHLRTITMVDDEPGVLDVMVRAARSWRYHVQSATCAEEAVELMECRPTPVVVTDLQMPGHGGVWLVREIQKRWPQTSIIVITGGMAGDEVAECLYAGAHHYFLKPVNLDEIRHALASTMRGYRTRHDESLLRERLERTVRKRTNQVRQTYLSAIESLVRTLEARDPYTSGHSQRVRHFALKLADLLGFDPRQRRCVSLASKLHDIGKLGLPEAILNKPGKLTAEEFAAVREHPVIGERILSPVIRNRSVLAAIRGHHERFAGGGYPDDLRGDQISLEARIISIVDCYDATTSDRAYRPAMTSAEAIALIESGSGTLFDPNVVRAFLEMVRREVLWQPALVQVEQPVSFPSAS